MRITDINLLVCFVAFTTSCGGLLGGDDNGVTGNNAGGIVATLGGAHTRATTSSGGTMATGGIGPTPGGAHDAGDTTTTTASGGKTATGGATGAGCVGNFEATQNIKGHSLCVANLVTITGPAGNADYQIDATEVTRGQYEGWVATNPALPQSGDAGSAAACGWKSSDSYAEDSICMKSSDVCQGPGCDHYPVVCVDWCDAYYYCAAVGKRLCGKIGGGSLTRSSSTDGSKSQWYWACSSGGVNDYPNGNAFDDMRACNSTACSGSYSNAKSLPVAALSACQSPIPGYTGVYDMSGNVEEWDDTCDETAYAGAACKQRGGAFNYYGSSGYVGCFINDSCDTAGGDSLDTVDSNLGFRCCSL